MKNEVAIVGGGPVGLRLASMLKKKDIPATIFEASSLLGGQMTTLYPEKKMEYPEEFKGQKALDAVSSLIEEAKTQNIRLSTRVLDFSPYEDGFMLKTNQGEEFFSYIVIATGIGLSKPRTMGLEGEDDLNNIFYSVKDPHIFHKKTVAVMGGGNSALDWAKQLTSIASKVYLIHRRNEFRGDAEDLNQYPVKVITPFIPISLTKKEHQVTSLTLEEVDTKEKIILDHLDAVLVFYGRTSEKTPFLLPEPRTPLFQGYMHKKNQESIPGVYVAGDASFKDRSEKRLEPGFKEAEIIVEDICKKRKL